MSGHSAHDKMGEQSVEQREASGDCYMERLPGGGIGRLAPGMSAHTG